MRKVTTALLATLLVMTLVGAAPALAEDRPTRYVDVVHAVADMVFDQSLVERAAARGLDVVNVAWEDTGRFGGSSVGPNISDVTIQVQYEDPWTEELQLALMPVIRHPNFTDVTADLDIDDFFLLVGNERGAELERVSLRDYLGDIRRYLSEPASWPGRQRSLLAGRDEHVLVSAQAAFLPVPRQGIAEFNPVIFNYQSYQGDPAVLTIVATREGTSATIVDNVRDGFDAGPTWGQRLFFNQDGERASLTGERLSDFVAGGGDRSGPSTAAAASEGLNMVLVVQVPLLQKHPLYDGGSLFSFDEGSEPAPAEQESDVERAVIGHGEVEGPFTEIDGVEIERDERFPIRVTVQFYQATTDGVVSDADLEAIVAQLDRVYADGDFVGSLVVDGKVGRPTEHDGPFVEPAGWWDAFWQRHTANTGLSVDETVALWQRLRLVAWRVMPGWLR